MWATTSSNRPVQGLQVGDRVQRDAIVGDRGGESLDVPAGQSWAGPTEHDGTMEDVTGEDFLDVVGRGVDVGELDGGADSHNRLADLGGTGIPRQVDPNVDRKLGFGDGVGPPADGHACPVSQSEWRSVRKPTMRSGQTEPCQRCRALRTLPSNRCAAPPSSSRRRRSSSCRLIPRSIRGSGRLTWSRG